MTTIRNVLLSMYWLLVANDLVAQTKLAPVPPMGWMTWNYFGENINEQVIREMADAMVVNDMVKAGYQYIMIDDGWQGGRDNRNNIIPDAHKFPSGIKALADYVHKKGLKLGIYSDASQLTCAGYTASLGFEQQDAMTFASWGIDYLKYDYCGAPADSITAKARYKTMSEALKKSGRDIIFAICEWGDRQPWLWARAAGGHVWRISGDIRDKWSSLQTISSPQELHGLGAGILDIADINANLYPYAAPGGFNDMDMLVVGLYGKKGPSGELGGLGCNDTEYQSQMSLWSIMAAPLIASNDLRNMNEPTKNILLNTEVIAISQDALARQAERKIKNEVWSIFVKPLSNGDQAICILNRSNQVQDLQLKFTNLGWSGKYTVRDLWKSTTIGRSVKWKGSVKEHESILLRLSPIRQIRK